MGWRYDPNPWRVPKFDKKRSLYEQELSEENEAYLEKTVLDKYKDTLKESTSPLKDGPWKRNEWTITYVANFYSAVQNFDVKIHFTGARVTTSCHLHHFIKVCNYAIFNVQIICCYFYSSRATFLT